jgi:outer membrane cobalamin receptor
MCVTRVRFQAISRLERLVAEAQMHTLARSALIALVLAAVASTSNATVFGTVKCVVDDPQQRPIPGATVTLRAQHADWVRSATTDEAGEVRVAPVPVGDYALEVSLDGFQTARQAVTVISDTARVVRVELQIAAVSQDVSVSAAPEAAEAVSATPTTLVRRGDIAGTPGAGRTNGLEMVTAFVPGSYVTHDQLHVRGGHQVSWLVDGVMVPNTNIASNVGPQFDPKDADYIEVRRGSYDAQYGDRTYAVFNVVPRTGFEHDTDAEVVLSAGSFGQTNDQVNAGGHTERFAYYASVNGNRSSLGLQTPVADVIHDRQAGLGAFTTLIFNAAPDNQLRLVASARRDTYQVPNDAAAQAAGVDDVERESDAFVNLSWVRAFGNGVLLTVSPFYHRNSARFDGGPADFPVSASEHRTSQYAGAQATIGVTAGRHQIEAGFYGFNQRDDQAFALAFTDGSSPDLGVRERPSGWLWSVFAQDTFRATRWLSITGGLRQTHFSGGLVENGTSPRAGVVIRIPSIGWTVRGFYGRFYQAPPLLTVSGPLLDFVTSQNLAVTPLRGERDEEFQAGITVPVRGWTLDADVFRTRATNFFDHNSVGNSNIFLPLTIDAARIRGAELTVRSPRAWKTVQVHAAYSNQVAEGSGGVTGGLTDFEAPSGSFPLDHDQRHTLSAGVGARFAHGFFAGGTVYYGSGFPDGEGPARLQGHTTVDLVLGKAVFSRLSVSLVALNVANRHLLIDNSETFGGTHFNNPRELYVEARCRLWGRD